MLALVHLAAGIGNLTFATPLLIAHELGYSVDLRLSADYDGAADLFLGWSVVRHVITGAAASQVPPAGYDAIASAIPPFYWPRFQRYYSPRQFRPPDALFYEDEQAYYLAFARALGYPSERRPECSLPIAPREFPGVTQDTIVLAPGCKTGEMALKRWPWFSQLAALFENVAVVGTPDNIVQPGIPPLRFPPHAHNFIGRLSLRETAELMAGAGLVIANDSGLAHVAAAVGVPTLIIFGPTPDRALGPMPRHVTVLRSGLACEPCWFRRRFESCRKQIDCLRQLTTERVAREVISIQQLDRTTGESQ
jgi:ADP-heptose:LPS heptosyltransferase